MVELTLELVSGTSLRVLVVDAEGAVSLVVADDSHEDADLVVVLLSPEGEVLAQRKTKVGVSG